MATSDKVFIHPQALVESDSIGDGTRVWAFAHVMKGARIGSGCNICDHTFIESNVVLGNNVTVKNGVSIWDRVTVEDDVFIGPNAVFTNDLNPRSAIKKPPEQWFPTLVRTGASIGANATIVCGIAIGRYAFVAAGAVVTCDAPDHALVMGVPGRVRGWMCRCGGKIQLIACEGTCSQCGAEYQKNNNGLAAITLSKANRQ